MTSSFLRTEGGLARHLRFDPSHSGWIRDAVGNLVVDRQRRADFSSAGGDTRLRLGGPPVADVSKKEDPELELRGVDDQIALLGGDDAVPLHHLLEELGARHELLPVGTLDPFLAALSVAAV